MNEVNTSFLNGTRFLMALWVAVGHFYIYLGGADFINIPLIGTILLSPAVAVDGFIIITGFLMMFHYLLKAEKEPPQLKTTHYNFWLRRIFRLYPLYILMIIIGFFIFDTRTSLLMEINNFFSNSPSENGFGIGNQSPGIAELISHVFMLQGLIPTHTSSILGVTWSLSLEMQFYVLFPFIFLLIFKNSHSIKSRLLISFVISIIVGLISIKISSMLGFYYHSVIFNKLPIFLLGMILAAVSLKKMSFKYLTIAVIIMAPFLNLLQSLVLGFIVLFINLYSFKDLLHPTIYKLLNVINDLLSNKISKFGADISYSLYLTHGFVFVFVVKFFIELSSNYSITNYQIALLAFPCYLIISFVICHFLYRFIEKPFIALGKRIIKNNNDTKVKSQKELVN